MATEFKLPELGEDVESGQVTRVLVQPGDTIEVDQSVIELETDKATVEVPSGVAGKVTEVRVNEGDEIRSGDVILTVEVAGAGPAAPEEPTEAVAEEARPEPEAPPKKPKPLPNRSRRKRPRPGRCLWLKPRRSRKRKRRSPLLPR